MSCICVHLSELLLQLKFDRWLFAKSMPTIYRSMIFNSLLNSEPLLPAFNNRN